MLDPLAHYQPVVDPPDEALDPETGEPCGRCFAFGVGALLVLGPRRKRPAIPAWDDLRRLDLPVVRSQFLGFLDGEPCWSAELPAGIASPPGTAITGLRGLFDRISDMEYVVAGRAAQIVAWERDHQFCGRCGKETQPVPGERARLCPGCLLTAYPRLSPAIIVLIERDDRILLARSPGFAPGRYGIIAGFVEPGETLEEAVRREAREEVGIELAAVEYFGSQPWPFPHGIMIGFRAVHAHGDLRMEDGELEDAGWYSLDDLPDIPGKLSIARQLIDDWAARRGAVLDHP